MAVEYEIKFLDADLVRVREELTKCGAVCSQPERFMRRTIFDFPDQRLGAIHAWVRLRDEGDQVTLSYKQFKSQDIDGMQEVELVVHDYETGAAFLAAIGLQPRSIQESKRETWVCEGVTITLDTWPWLPPFIEIEAATETEVRNFVEQLGYAWEQGVFGGIVEVFKQYYEVTSDEINQMKELCFTPMPDWLLARKREKSS